VPKVRVNDISMNYEQQGTGEPLILIPYLAADSSLSRLRDVYASCSINSIILLIPMRWFAARRSARLISCRPAQCPGRDLMESLSANLPSSAQNVL
jgi:hypothetical protein